TAAPARPTAKASSVVKSTFATPRIPSVPKSRSLPAMRRRGPRQELRLHAHEVRHHLHVRDLLARGVYGDRPDHRVEFRFPVRELNLDTNRSHLRERFGRTAYDRA